MVYDRGMIRHHPRNLSNKKGGLMALDTFGKRLKVLRVDRGLSQIDLRDQMEKLCGVSIGETYVSELERTTKMPGLQVAAAMAKVLDVSLDYLGLLIDDASVSYQRFVPASYLSEEADEVAQLVDAMRPEQRALVANLARNLSLPVNERERRRAEAQDILDSVERDLGLEARKRVERIMRNKGLLLNNS
jgi:transcriptional regulator with XRE-family HTH domain